jgi:hypothetical protein
MVGRSGGQGDAVARIDPLEPDRIHPEQTQTARDEVHPPRRRSRQSEAVPERRPSHSRGCLVFPEVVRIELGHVDEVAAELFQKGDVRRGEGLAFAEPALAPGAGHVVAQDLPQSLIRRDRTELHVLVPIPSGFAPEPSRRRRWEATALILSRARPRAACG